MYEKSLLKKGYAKEKDSKKSHKVLPVCYLCSKVPEDGIRGGFFLKGIFICNECEKELINSRPERKEEYMLTIAKLRGILFQDKYK